VALSVDLRKACRRSLDDSIDYSRLKEADHGPDRKGRIPDVEAVAKRIARSAFDDVRVKAAQVHIERILTTEPGGGWPSPLEG